MKIFENSQDVTQEEVAKLKLDIEYLESVLTRIRSGTTHCSERAFPRLTQNGHRRRPAMLTAMYSFLD
jgi:hypothetical protein